MATAHNVTSNNRLEVDACLLHLDKPVAQTATFCSSNENLE